MSVISRPRVRLLLADYITGDSLDFFPCVSRVTSLSSVCSNCSFLGDDQRVAKVFYDGVNKMYEVDTTTLEYKML